MSDRERPPTAEVPEHRIGDVMSFDDAPTLMRDVAARRRHVLTAVFVVDGTG